MYVNKDPFREPLDTPNRYPHINPNQKAPKKPEPLTINDLFPKIDRWGIGFDPVFDTLRSLSTASTASYPPYNIVKYEEGKFEIYVAIAGFKKGEVAVTVNERTLTIKSDTEFKDGDVKEVRVGKMLHQGIAQRDFTLNFALADFVEVESATMEDGILTVKLFTNLPEEKKPKVIDIK